MKPLIVGVDPGSTSAVAAVDLDGEIELLESGKNFPPREIIQRIIKVGKPVVVAADKGKTPSKVEKIASSVGAKLFEPEEDLSSERKRDLGKGANSHELDAVASAVYARKQLQRDIRKIEKYDDELDQSREVIAEKIFNDEPIRGEKEEESEEDPVEEAESSEDPEVDPEKKRLEKKVGNLEEQVQKLRSELGEKNSTIDSMEEKIQELKEEEREEVVENREVKKREAIIRDKNDEIEKLEEELEKFRIREMQYRKALEKIFEEEHSPVPLVDEHVERVPEEAVTSDSEVLEKLEKRGAEIHHVEDVEGVELNDFVVVDELPDKTDFESVIKEYRRKR
jgi:predicted RNase H-like nuclease (RuvC/YqgF family)